MLNSVCGRPACRPSAAAACTSTRPLLFPGHNQRLQNLHRMPSPAWQQARMPASPAPVTLLAAARGVNAIETAIRQDLGMESTKLPDDVRQRVEGAIQRNRYRVTVGEVAAQAGVTLAEAETALKALAFDSQAVLQVSNDGDVVYSFSRDFQSVLRNKSVSLRVKPALQKAQSFALLTVRIAFGTALFASIVITFIAITAVLNGRRDDDRGDRGGGGYYSRGFSFGPDLWWYWSPDYSSRRQADGGSGSMSLPEAIFSFVFGDGDPNAEYEERRWRALGRYIQSRKGVVTAEEMAPYLDPQPPASGSSLPGTDESFVLPALIKFGGEAFVDDDGQLLYRFPSLQKTVLQREVLGRRSAPRAWGRAAQRARGRRREVDEEEEERGYSGDDRLPQPQYENRWQMTAAEPGQVAATIGLGLLNFAGVATLGSLLSDPSTRVMLMREGYAWIPAVLPFLSSYAAAFFGIPLVRYIRNIFMNKSVDERNDAREEAAQRLAAPSAGLQRKLASARQQGESKLITSRDIVFTTDQDAAPQANARDLRDWDARLGSGSSGEAKGVTRRGVKGDDGW